MRAAVVLALGLAVALAAPTTARADDDLAALEHRPIVFARGNALYKGDARGKSEVELATLPSKTTVRALRSDARGKILLADLGGAWYWMPLDGSTKTLTALPCDAGPAQLTEDAAYVLCRARNSARGSSLVVNLTTGKLTPINVPALGARLVGTGNERKLVWADGNGVWSAIPPLLRQPKKVAPEPPMRALLPSPDGSRALGVYRGEIFEGARHKKPADVLSVFTLDGVAARRTAIQRGVPVEWSHDGSWVLVQDGSSACIMLAAGGQYKCWRGFTAAAIAPDGKYALLLGNRDKYEKQAKKEKSSSKKSKKKGKKGSKKKKEPEPEPEPEEPAAEPAPEDVGDEDGGTDVPVDDVAVPPPSGPLALFRASLDGAFTSSPAMIYKVVDGGAVFVATP